MGDRLRDYGFMNPFRTGAYLEGSNINQWLTDIATYNYILQKNNIVSTVEFAVRDNNGNIVEWTKTPPPLPSTQVTMAPSQLGMPQTYNLVSRNGLQTMPEYRWKIEGDINTANQELREAGIQTSRQMNNNVGYLGAYIPEIVPVEPSNVRFSTYPNSGYSEKIFLPTGDPLGFNDVLQGRSNDSLNKAYKGINPQFYISPGSPMLGTANTAGSMRSMLKVGENQYWMGPADRAGSDTLEIAKQFFKPAEASVFFQNPQGLFDVLTQNPNVNRQIYSYITDKAAYYRAKDSEGGGPLGVIAKGLSTAGMFSGVASGLFGALSGIGSLSGGTGGLLGAAQAGAAAASSFPSLTSIISGITGWNPIAVSAGLGALSNADEGWGRALLGGLSGGIREMGGIGTIAGPAIGMAGDYLLPGNEMPRNPPPPSYPLLAPSAYGTLPGGQQGFTQPVAVTPTSNNIYPMAVGTDVAGSVPVPMYNSMLQGLLGPSYGSNIGINNFANAQNALSGMLAYQPKLFDSIGGIGSSIPSLQGYNFQPAA